jgi:hypothetical protein
MTLTQKVLSAALVVLVAAGLVFASIASSDDEPTPQGELSAEEVAAYEALDAVLDPPTPTSMAFHEFEPAPTDGYRITMLDGVVRIDGAISGPDAAKVDQSLNGLCRHGDTDIAPGRGLEVDLPDIANDRAREALGRLDCSVSTFRLDVDADGVMSGLVSTTDPAGVTELQSHLGNSVRVLVDGTG